jgi:hypothetical protein
MGVHAEGDRGVGVTQAGGSEPGPVEPSRRMIAWKWTTPQRWYSATLAKETRSYAARALLVSPAWRARVLRRVMVKRRHSSGAQALNTTEPQFPGGAVDVIDAPAQQDGLDTPARRTPPAGRGRRVNGGAPLVGGRRAEADLWPGTEVKGVKISGAMPRLAR